MKVLVIGAAGMIGRKLIESLLEKGELTGRKIDSILAFDVVEAEFDNNSVISIDSLAGDFAASGQAEKLVTDKPDVIFHLAAIVSGEAETDFDKGYRINLAAVQYLFDAIRQQSYMPRVVYASSIAVFGAPFDDPIKDDFHLTPLTSYGTQKAIGELLLADYSRKGIFDGIGLRFPTIVVRPGAANLAASSFFSNIIREPLAGKEAILPVSKDVKHWMASPKSAAGFCIHAAEIDGDKVGPRRNLTLPGIAATVGEMIEALGRVAGQEAVDLIKDEPDEAIISIVGNWPREFDASRAISLGFTCESSFDEIVQAHIDDMECQ